MTDQKPTWPESLPPFTEFTEGARRVHLNADNLSAPNAIADLVHDLYWFSDDEFYLFFAYGVGIGKDLDNRLKQHGVEMRRTEMYFYRHPKPSYENDFIRVLPGSDVPSWQREASTGDMYGRTTLTLSPVARKHMDFTETASRTRDAIAESEPVIEAKPNLFGFAINLQSLWRKVRRWFPRA